MVERKRLRLGIAVAVLSVMGSVAVWAQGPGGDAPPQDGAAGMGPHRPPMERALGPGGGPGGFMRGERGRWWNDAKAIEKYKLTDSQRKSMDDIFQQSRASLIDLHASLDKQELAMEPLMKADQPDEGKILSQIDRVAQARAELEKSNARMLLGIRRQLTPEQWKQMEADREARRAARGAGGGPGAEDGHRWHGRGPGPASGGPGGAGPDGAPGPGSGPENE